MTDQQVLLLKGFIGTVNHAPDVVPVTRMRRAIRAACALHAEFEPLAKGIDDALLKMGWGLVEREAGGQSVRFYMSPSALGMVKEELEVRHGE